MDVKQANKAAFGNPTTAERTSDRELVVTRMFDAPARLVFQAWTDPKLFERWWAPASFGVYIVSREADVRTGGSYKQVMGHPSLPEPMTFFGRYIEVAPPSRLVWTNEEGPEGGQVTTVTFDEIDGQTRVVYHELYPSKDALDEAISNGSTSCFAEQFQQLDELLAE